MTFLFNLYNHFVPSLCGLLMDGWRSDDSPHVINITVPGNAVQGQEHVAVLKLQTFGASHDSFKQLQLYFALQSV
jgi:hypothetical protein